VEEEARDGGRLRVRGEIWNVGVSKQNVVPSQSNTDP